MSVEIGKGPRATKLDEILALSLKQTMRACSYEKLVSCFPTLAQKDPETLKHAQEQVNDFLATACQSEFHKILGERETVMRLNELDNLIADAKRRKDSGAPPIRETLSDIAPDIILRAHLMPLKREELKQLNMKTLAIQKENMNGLANLESQRRYIEQGTRTLRESLRELEVISR